MRAHRLYIVSPLIVTMCFSVALIGQQIVPNSSFELWETSPEGTYEPVGWETDNTEKATSVSPTTLAYSGYLAMHVTTYETGVGAYGNAMTTIPTTTVPTNLIGAVRYQTTDMGQVLIHYTLLDQGTIVGSGYWSPTNSESLNWEFIDLIVEDPGVPITDITLLVHAAVGDLAFGTAEITVDDFFFQGILDVDAISPSYLNVYPNPTNERLIIEYKGLENSVSRIRVVDLNGRVVLDLKASLELDVSGLAQGRYQVEILDSKGVVLLREGVVIE